ncbi:MAG: M1 family metallopeptidase [Candidatus Levybacteria bacterium]|nr:M1 family metallopeptidase [Candidatus Levybacteria bacterium]
MKRKKSAFRLPVHVTPTRYEIMLKPDLEGFTFEGEETIELSINKSTKEITLHAVELDIESAEFIHGSKETWAGEIAYNTKNETATFAFPKRIQKGKGKLRLTFRGILNDKMVGFYKSRYGLSGQERFLATTQFEATHARRAFPSFDEPHQKAIFDITLIVPSHTTAISNTFEIESKEHEAGYKIVKFAPTPKMSTYLLAFIVGEFEYIEKKTKEGILVRVFVTPGKKEQATFALDTACKLLSFYNDYFGIQYPLPVLDLIAIPDFSHGAMENWGAVTYRESTLLVDEAQTTLREKQWIAMVIAHELAHMWFGNLVTMRWWTHLWLNEGFASFIEYVAIDNVFPEWHIWTQFVYLEQGIALRLDGLQNTHPIEIEVHHPDEISEIFDKVSYSKGASVIRMLSEYLGPIIFQKGLQHYLVKHQYSNAETQDLWKSLEEVSGKPVTKIMQNWTGKPGYPVISVRKKGDQLHLTQQRFITTMQKVKKKKDNTLWSIPLEDHLMTKKTMDLPKPKDRFVKMNVGEHSFVRIGYASKLLSLLQGAVSQKQLPPPDRLGIARDAFDLSFAGKTSISHALLLLQSYKKEDNYIVWAQIVTALSHLTTLLADEPFFENFQAYCRSILSPIAKKVGWEKKQNEDHFTTLLRSLVLYHFGTNKATETIKKAQSLFPLAIKGSIDADLESVVFNLAAENGGEKEHEILINTYKKTMLHQRKDRIASALGKFKSESLLLKTLAFSLSKDVRSQSTIGILHSVWGNPQGRNGAWDFVQNHWKTFHERYMAGHMLSRLIQAADSFTTIEKAREIKNFFDKNKTPGTKRTVLQVLEQITSNALFLTTNRKELAKFLRKAR